MPTARAPLILAICPTAEPTAPEAAETTTVSPGLGWPMSSRPTYAVIPGMPSPAGAGDMGACLVPGLGDAAARAHRVRLPAVVAQHDVAPGDPRVLRFDHLADGGAH